MSQGWVFVAKPPPPSYRVGMGRPGWRSRIERVTPEEVVLSENGRVPVQVRGFALGWVQLGSDRRRVFGTFEHTFSVETKGQHIVAVGGLLGHAERLLSFQPRHDLVVPKPCLNGKALTAVLDSALPQRTLRCATRGIQARIHVSVGRSNLVVPSENSHE